LSPNRLGGRKKAVVGGASSSATFVLQASPIWFILSSCSQAGRERPAIRRSSASERSSETRRERKREELGIKQHRDNEEDIFICSQETPFRNATNVQWSDGHSLLRPMSIQPTRLMRARCLISPWPVALLPLAFLPRTASFRPSWPPSRPAFPSQAPASLCSPDGSSPPLRGP